jgi:hypothetical protein
MGTYCRRSRTAPKAEAKSRAGGKLIGGRQADDCRFPPHKSGCAGMEKEGEKQGFGLWAE